MSGNGWIVGTLDVAGRPDGTASAVSVDLSVSAGLDLPGLRLRVDDARVEAQLSVRLRPPGLEMRAVPMLPAGAGAELTLPGVTGSGYLRRDGDRWAGALSARLGPVAVSGFGILDLSGGGLSLVALLAAEFDVPVQLSFGFTLVGVGGLVGLGRRPDIPALQAAASSGELSRLLFPRVPIVGADRLLPVLNGCFPAAPGSAVAGPMLKLGWGTPTVVAATIAVLASDDGVVIIGRVAITLPFEQAALIRLEALVFGTITGDGLSIEATLANSRIVGIPVDGELRLRLRTGDDPLFALSAGGFHPAFTPPDGMAGMTPIHTEISPGPMLRARLAAYLAVTTESVQFGARAELRAGIDGFNISGHFAFDALIQLDPFGFAVDFSARVSVECADFCVGSLGLSGHLSGPSPWRIHGHASVSVLWWDVDVDIPELTWGSSDAPQLPKPRAPLDVLLGQLRTASNWTASTAPVPAVVELRPGPDHGAAAVHPLAELRFAQTTVPLGVALQRMDGVPLPAAVTLRVSAGDPEPPLTMTPAAFAPGQFLALDATSALAGAGYAQFDAGFLLTPNAVVFGPKESRSIDPELCVIARRFRFPTTVSLGPPLALAATTGHGHAPAAVASPLVRLRDPGAAVVAGRAALLAANDQLAA
ncbi:DUF6603 domain-containing protein, partial [Frankia sp. Cj5]|uniref:DUF6603 domain-containing protein n=2 Tax=unclassified Frankia TaxID=2632575 RepID=UPI001EF53B08